MKGRTAQTAYDDLAAKRLVLSSEMLSLTPLSRGREMYALLPLPMMKTLFNLSKRIMLEIPVEKLNKELLSLWVVLNR